MQPLDTDRLILRPLVSGDAVAIQRHFPRWEIVRYLTRAVPWPYPADGAAHFVNAVALPGMARGDQWLWRIARRGSPDELIGLVHLRRYSAEGHRGFWLAVEHHGRGYMTEAVAAVNDHAFDVLGFDHLIVMNARNNTASRRVKQKTGAVLLATGPCAPDRYHGGFTEQEVWQLTADDWRRFRAGTAG